MSALIEISPGVFGTRLPAEQARVMESWTRYYDAAVARGEIIGTGWRRRDDDVLRRSRGPGWAS